MISSKKRLIGVVPLGDVPEMALKVIAAHISRYLNLSAQILTSFEKPEYAFDPIRFQYDAGTILKAFESEQFTDFQKVVGVMSHDIFVPIFTHVFGEARQGGKFALVSLFRLGKTPYSRFSASTIIFQRAAKVALHELGHLFNLHHCERPSCLMHFSGGLDDLDETPLLFCEYCLDYYEYNLLR